MSNIWVTSDTHFNHIDILTFKHCCRKEFDSVDHMNQCMFDNWNSVVGVDDIVYHLGDVLFGIDKEQWLAENFNKLNGKKHLILGNHDNPKFLAPYFKSISMWKTFNDIGLLLSHTPQHASTLAETHRFKENILNVHGHIHFNPSPAGPYKCVCVEQTNYTPVNIDELTL